MLSRSNSDAGSCLYRVNPTPSTYATSHGRCRTSNRSDPFLSRRCAEVAAVEAYNRALDFTDSRTQPYRAVPPKLQRRRSQLTGRTEGSHLEDARLGRRRSTSNRADAERSREAPAIQNFPPRRVAAVSSADEGERLRTKQRSITRLGSAEPQSTDHHQSQPPSSRRQTSSSYDIGSSNTRKYAAPVISQYAGLPPESPAVGYHGTLAHLSDFGEPLEANLHCSDLPKPSIRETQTDEQILAIARDRCLLDFQQRKVRERKSILLAPFQRRKDSAMQRQSDLSHDSAMPPCNDSSEFELAQPPLTCIPTPTPRDVMKGESKHRDFSQSLRYRIMKILGRTSKPLPDLPVQHVNAKILHYNAGEEAHYNLSKKEPPSSVSSESWTAVLPPDYNANSETSRNSKVKSRVTSWTNSTTVDTSSAGQDTEQPVAVQSHHSLTRTVSLKTLRKASSILGKSIRNKMRRPSRAEMNHTQECENLHTAPQEPLGLPITEDVRSDQCDNDITEETKEQSALCSLPSYQQQQRSSDQRYNATIRSVTPEPNLQRFAIPSPVAEIVSLTGDSTEQPTPTSYLQRRPAIKSAPPSKEQIARRMERSKNRWQSPLDELSPTVFRSVKTITMRDNMHEQHSTNSSTRYQPMVNDLPHSVNVAQHNQVKRQDFMSPSIYSRATDAASPYSETTVETPGMTVRITGREVRTYDFSPKKTSHTEERPVKASQEWRRWLSDEMSNFKSDKDTLTLPPAFLKVAEPSSGPEPAPAVRQRSESDSSGQRVRPQLAARQRPRATSRRSSFMNERYPMIDTSRNSSDRSLRCRNASRTGAGISDSESPVATSAPPTDRPTQSTSTSQCQHAVKERHSIDQINVATNRRHRSVREGVEQKTITGAARPTLECLIPTATSEKAALPSKVEHNTTAMRPASVLQLRANYRGRKSEETKPLEVRRKPVNDMQSFIEDTTILDISAGPYAAQRSVAVEEKENAPPFDPSALPALSSSEWLAAGTKKARKLAAAPELLTGRTASRCSPKTGVPKEGKESPAQRMATEFLERNSRQNTPAFI